MLYIIDIFFILWEQQLNLFTVEFKELCPYWTCILILTSLHTVTNVVDVIQRSFYILSVQYEFKSSLLIALFFFPCRSAYFFTCVYCEFRRHPTPTKEMLEPLLRTAAAVGLDLDVSSSRALADSLDRAVVRIYSDNFFLCLWLLLEFLFYLLNACNTQLWS